jgi:hypothetical protein
LETSFRDDKKDNRCEKDIFESGHYYHIYTTEAITKKIFYWEEKVIFSLYRSVIFATADGVLFAQ